jgi:hypothetical protein
MHGLHTCTLHNIETLEPLTWIWVRPSLCYRHPTLAHTHALYCHYWTSVNIRHSNRLLDLTWPSNVSHLISTQSWYFFRLADPTASATKKKPNLLPNWPKWFMYYIFSPLGLIHTRHFCTQYCDKKIFYFSQ